ncbi:MAG: hypothetical protein NUW01_05095, partial [Gemmatimonadaceae bacterium]|nr:hypothetical protein [Gemmatimonadaceae bacterium]
MSLLYGCHFEHQGSGAAIPHILSYLTARTVADDGLFEVWNGPTNAARVLRVSKEGQVQGADGTLAKPTYSFESEKTTGLHYVGANNVALVIAGANIVNVVAAGVAVTGTFAASGNVAINTNKFTVTAASGNTLVAGTLGVTGALTATGGMDGVVGGVSPAAATFTTLNATGGGALTGTWTNLGAVTTVDINGGTVGGVTLDGTISGTPTWASSQSMNINGTVGATTPAAGAFTTGTFSGTLTIDTPSSAVAWPILLLSNNDSLVVDTQIIGAVDMYGSDPSGGGVGVRVSVRGVSTDAGGSAYAAVLYSDVGAGAVEAARFSPTAAVLPGTLSVSGAST